MWQVEPTEEYERRLKHFSKKMPRETEAILANLARYLAALNQGASPKQIQGGWVHPEPMDVVALTERGGGKKVAGKNLGKGLRPLRLYVYPETATRTLCLITLGDKPTQSADIHDAKKYVERRRSQRDAEAEEVQQRHGDGS